MTETYHDGGVAYGSNSVDLDTTTISGAVLVSYSQYYGREAGDNSMDPAWGTGSVAFKLRKGMAKLDERMEFDAYRPEDAGKEYRMLASDVLWLWNSSTQVWTHESPGIRGATNSTYGELRAAPSEANASDFNYVNDDGAAHTIGRVGYQDLRVTLTRASSPWGWAWILPEDE